MKIRSQSIMKATLLTASVIIASGCAAVAKPQMSNDTTQSAATMKSQSADDVLLYSNQCIRSST